MEKLPDTDTLTKPHEAAYCQIASSMCALQHVARGIPCILLQMFVRLSTCIIRKCSLFFIFLSQLYLNSKFFFYYFHPEESLLLIHIFFSGILHSKLQIVCLKSLTGKDVLLCEHVVDHRNRWPYPKRSVVTWRYNLSHMP